MVLQRLVKFIEFTEFTGQFEKKDPNILSFSLTEISMINQINHNGELITCNTLSFH